MLSSDPNLHLSLAELMKFLPITETGMDAPAGPSNGVMEATDGTATVLEEDDDGSVAVIAAGTASSRLPAKSIPLFDTES